MCLHLLLLPLLRTDPLHLLLQLSLSDHLFPLRLSLQWDRFVQRRRWRRCFP
jgi:hypothetical protein